MTAVDKSSTSLSPSAPEKKRKRQAQFTNTKAKKSNNNVAHPELLSTTLGSATITTRPTTRTLIIDNGGDTLKYGWITDLEPRVLPNISARLMHQFTTLVGDELDHAVQNPKSLIAHTRSMERGIITNLENQTRVWKRMLDLLGILMPLKTDAAQCLGWNIMASRQPKGGRKMVANTAASVTILPPPPTIPAHTVAIILLLPPHFPRVVLDQIFHIWFEDFGVGHVGLGISSVCASFAQIQSMPWKTSCTVDMGWSQTLVIPTFQDRLIKPSAVRRLPLGGRHMINMLKYYMSYRQYNLMDQTQLMRQVFETLSYCSLDIKEDMDLARQKPLGRRRYDRDFVLPDYHRTYQGEIRIPLPLQRDLEREAKKQQQEEADQNCQEEDDDEEEDEDFEADEDEEMDDNDSVDEDAMREQNSSYKHTKDVKQKQRKSEKKEGNSDDRDSNSDDGDDEEETLEQKRKRILQQRANEQRRRAEQEEEEQILLVSVERFAIPEVLFRPQDAGLQSDLVGLAHAIVQSVQACPIPYRPALYQTIYLVGGLSSLQNLKPRLELELRCLMPSDYKMNVFIAESPITRAWFGAKALFKQEPYPNWSISRREWDDVSKRKAYAKLMFENGGLYV